MRVIIAAAGPRPRWAGHLGLPSSHLAPTNDGETLLARTIRQALTLTDDVHVTVPDDERYAAACGGATRHVRDGSGNEYTSTRDLWSADDRTVLLLGDVYFTDEALSVIAAGSPTAYRVFGRYRASRHTGCPYGEIFAASWGPQRHSQMDLHLAEVARLRKTGQCLRPPGWVLLRLWQATPVGQHVVKGPIWAEVDDLTDDLDVPADWERHPAFGRATPPPDPAPKPKRVRKPRPAAETSSAASIRTDFAAIVAEHNIAHLVHVGAHDGEEATGYLTAGVARLTLVEPNPVLAGRLRTRHLGDDRVTVVEAACGAEQGEAFLNIPERTNMASLAAAPGGVPARAERVSVRRLDDVAPDADAAVIDVQGHEFEVLAAAPWATLRLLMVETCTVDDPSLSPPYEAMTAYMTSRGWREVARYGRDYDWIQRWAFGRTTHTGGEVRDVVYVRGEAS